jgi:drug resistance transporter, EmrB/QacA subfamily
MNETPAQGNGVDRPLSTARILTALSAIIVGAFMVMLDSTAMNVLLPRLMEEFAVSYTTVQWVVTGYLLAEAAVIPLAGWLSDRYGIKKVFLAGLGVFTVGSLSCAVSQDLAALIASRIVQGAGGGIIIPILFAYTYRLSPPERVGKIMGLVVLPIIAAPALGPVMSGLIVDHAAWNWIFAANVPIGIAAVWYGVRKLPAVEKQAASVLDKWGLLLGPLAFAALCFAVSEAEEGWGSARSAIALAVGGIALAAFIFRQLRHEHPLLELRVFGSAAFARSIVVLWIAVFAQYGTLFLIPQILLHQTSFSAFETGLLMLPHAALAAVSNQIGGRLFDKVGIRPLALLGLILLAAGQYLLSRIDAATSALTIVAYISVVGMSVGFCITPLVTHLLKVSPQHLVNRVSSLSSATQQVVVSFSISGLAALLTGRFREHSADAAARHDVWASAFQDVLIVVILLTLLGAALSAWIPKPRPQ